MQVDFSEWRKERIQPTKAREVIQIIAPQPDEPEVDTAGLDFGDWTAA